MPNKNKILVSIRLMTFNHAEYISEAIESCLMQKTNFKYEIVIGDDYSTDGTLEICEEYQNKYPTKIKLLKRPIGGNYWKNRKEKGRLYNFVNILENCSGEYIALLDGDDYWTDPLKLQKQVDILDKNRNVSICGHETNYVSQDGKFIRTFSSSIERLGQKSTKNYIIDLKEKFNIKLEIFHSSSFLFRKNLILYLPNNFHSYVVGDIPLLIFLMMHGKAYYLYETMSSYRQHNSSITKQNIDLELINANMKKMYLDLINHLDPHFHKQVFMIITRIKYNYLLTNFTYNPNIKRLIKIILKKNKLSLSYRDILYLSSKALKINH